MLKILDNLSLPSNFIEAIAELMEVAEVIFGAKTGEQKKAWVKNAALDLAAKIDIPVLPDAIERPVEEAIISIVIEVLWAMLFTDAALEVEEIGVDERELVLQRPSPRRPGRRRPFFPRALRN